MLKSLVVWAGRREFVVLEVEIELSVWKESSRTWSLGDA